MAYLPELNSFRCRLSVIPDVRDCRPTLTVAKNDDLHCRPSKTAPDIPSVTAVILVTAPVSRPLGRVTLRLPKQNFWRLLVRDFLQAVGHSCQ